jgi:hypothetical protein
MVGSPVFGWSLTILFALTGLFVSVRGARDGTGRISGALHLLMGAAMIAMVWPWGRAVPGWLQVAVFGPAAVWFAVLAAGPQLTGAAGPREVRWRHGHHALMAAAMVWMAAAVRAPMDQAMSPMPDMPGMDMPGMALPAGVVVVSLVLAGYSALAAAGWVFAAVRGGGGRVLDATCHAGMSAGMAVLLVAMT